jgi:hypothetical protein
MQAWWVERIELGDRAYYERRAENDRSKGNRYWAIVSRYPFQWFNVALDTGGSLLVRSVNGWPGSWRDSVIGRCEAQLVGYYDGLIQ